MGTYDDGGMEQDGAGWPGRTDKGAGYRTKMQVERQNPDLTLVLIHAQRKKQARIRQSRTDAVWFGSFASSSIDRLSAGAVDAWIVSLSACGFVQVTVNHARRQFPPFRVPPAVPPASDYRRGFCWPLSSKRTVNSFWTGPRMPSVTTTSQTQRVGTEGCKSIYPMAASVSTYQGVWRAIGRV
ncbi:hypothetical protein X797_005211 [Metarhizium robertsii]|uniref:Uncharacterized protein n=1 Tax=Metarhizium robertsii TaxID=568076 RepID=A0A0A1UVC6_9HYPO|nr:hypothetical protein X797_005211 [Metarhizium robertsii]